ncbi:MAG: hypothetical protein ABIJ61_09350 [bacterium]
MLLKTLTAILLLSAVSGQAAENQLVLRIKGGWSIPTGELEEKTFTVGDFQTIFKSSGVYSLAGEASLRLSALPFDIALDAGRHLFSDDAFGEIEETTYEYPTGTGRVTDFHHRIYSFSLKAEMPVALAYRAVTTLGAGFGWYFYKYVNLGDFDRAGPFPPSHSHPGWQLSLTQTFEIHNRVGLLFAFEYHSFDVGDDDNVGFAPAGAINRINFYCIHLGLSFRVVN